MFQLHVALVCKPRSNSTLHTNEFQTDFLTLGFISLTVTLGDTLDLILLLDGVTVGRTSSGVDEFLSKALSHGLEVTERSLTGTGSEQVQGVVDATERGHIDGLSSDNTGSTNTGGVLTRSRVDNGIHNDLHWVLVGKKVDDFQSVLDDTARHKLLSGVTALLHQAASKTLQDWARSLAKALLLVTSGSVWKVSGMVSLARNVVLW